MKNYVRDEYNRQVRALMEKGFAISIENNSGSFSGEKVRMIFDGANKGEYYGVVVTEDLIYSDQHEELGVHGLISFETCVKVVKWEGAKVGEVLWLKDAEEISSVEFYSGHRENPLPKAEANARAEKQYDRWEAKIEWNLEDKTDDQAVREVVLRHARKQRGTKRANDSDIVKITKDNERTPASGFRYMYIISKRNGEEERRYF